MTQRKKGFLPFIIHTPLKMKWKRQGQTVCIKYPCGSKQNDRGLTRPAGIENTR